MKNLIEEIKDDLYRWNRGKDFDEWSSVIGKLNILKKK